MQAKKEQAKHIYLNRLPLFSWLVVPFFALWLAVSYLIGLFNPTDWQKPLIPKVSNKAVTEKITVSSFDWKGTGLITLWFDDAWYSQYSIALPVLEKNQMKGALAVPTDMVNGEEYMSWPQIQRMQYLGWEIDSHSRSHQCDINNFDDERIKSEIEGSKEILEQQNLPVQNYVSPCGKMTGKMLSQIKKTYLSHRSTDDGLNDLPVANPYHLNIYAVDKSTSIADVRTWIKEAKGEKKWLIIVFHQIGSGSEEYEISPNFFLETIDLVKKSNLPVVLPSQALNVSL